MRLRHVERLLIGRAGGGHGTRHLAGRQRGGIEGARRSGRKAVDRVLVARFGCRSVAQRTRQHPDHSRRLARLGHRQRTARQGRHGERRGGW
ncbi:hypothetical protein, partial [Sphingomonas sanguinis]|uniref:hypothetical protein n=1 Tax=Sphingomonas sanguinis TaxID=33051 RepID=UPI00128F2984